MTLAPEVVEKLAAPLDPKRVKKREGSGGRSLSYLEGHDAVRTANEVFGVGGWTYFVSELTCLGEEPVERYDKKGYRVAYRAIVTAGSGGVGYSDVGYGDAQEYTGSKLTPHELASKEAVTDALKRALKNFGDQFGLCLYDKDAPEHNGRNNGVAPTDGNRAGAAQAAAVSDASGDSRAPAAAAPTDDGWRWASGKHEGKTLAETPVDYIKWYAGNGPKPDAKERCNAFLLGGELEAVGAVAVGDPDEGIPF